MKRNLLNETGSHAAVLITAALLVSVLGVPSSAHDGDADCAGNCHGGGDHCDAYCACEDNCVFP